MNSRLKVICVLFGIVYLFIIADNVWQLFWSSDIDLDNIAGSNWKDNLEKRLAGDSGFFIVKVITGVILMFLSYLFSAAISLIYIPVQAYKTLRSIVEYKIFNTENITRIRRVGYATIINFALLLFIVNPIIKWIVSLIVAHDNPFLLLFNNSQYYGILLVGLLTLLFAEILKICQGMKTEQDLTI